MMEAHRGLLLLCCAVTAGTVCGCRKRNESHRAAVVDPAPVGAPELHTDLEPTVRRSSPGEAKRRRAALLPARPIDELKCEGCHTAFNSMPVVHPPAKIDGCFVCHVRTGKVHPVPLELEFRFEMEGTALCSDCHPEQEETLGPHEVLEERACLGCHDAHVSLQPKLLRREPRKLCVECHDTVLAASGGDGSLHAPVAGRLCVECHDPHSEQGAPLLRRSYARRIKSAYAATNTALCFQCHDVSLVESATTEEATGFRDGKRNLHTVHVVKQGRTCRACHEVHTSRQPHLIRTELPYGRRGWKLRIVYLQEHGGGACLASCHVERSYRR